MTTSTSNLTIDVDPANPGQFFACCGLLELAHRLWPGAEGWFGNQTFFIAAQGEGASLSTLASMLSRMEMCSENLGEDEKTAPLLLRQKKSTVSGGTHLPLRLDWWLDTEGKADLLKTWAGRQGAAEISRAMLHTVLHKKLLSAENCLSRAIVATDADGKKKEPFYFDARRFASALDTGFSLDAQDISTTAHPTTEFLAFIGLQRFRPYPMSKREFTYWTWPVPLSPSVASAAACGALRLPGWEEYRFSLRFRDDQKRYKAFAFASKTKGVPT